MHGDPARGRGDARGRDRSPQQALPPRRTTNRSVEQAHDRRRHRENFAAEVGGPRKAARRPRRVVTPKTHARAPSPAQDDADEDHAAARMARLNLAGRAKVADLRAAIAKVKAEVGSVDGARAGPARQVRSGMALAPRRQRLARRRAVFLLSTLEICRVCGRETILQQLASPEARRDGLRSVRQLCAADLACCGQWPELCDSLRAALSDPDEECRADAVDVHAHFFKEASSQQMAHLFCNLSADALHHVRATAHVVCGFVDEAKASSSLCRKFGALAQMLPALADHLGVLASDQLEHTVTSALLLATNLLPRRPEGGAAALRSGLLLLPALAGGVRSARRLVPPVDAARAATMALARGASICVGASSVMALPKARRRACGGRTRPAESGAAGAQPCSRIELR